MLRIFIYIILTPHFSFKKHRAAVWASAWDLHVRHDQAVNCLIITVYLHHVPSNYFVGQDLLKKMNSSKPPAEGVACQKLYFFFFENLDSVFKISNFVVIGFIVNRTELKG